MANPIQQRGLEQLRCLRDHLGRDAIEHLLGNLRIGLAVDRLVVPVGQRRRGRSSPFRAWIPDEHRSHLSSPRLGYPPIVGTTGSEVEPRFGPMAKERTKRPVLGRTFEGRKATAADVEGYERRIALIEAAPIVGTEQRDGRTFVVRQLPPQTRVATP